MSMVRYVNLVTRSSYYHLHTISRIRHNLDSDTRAATVRALVLSRLDYANSLLAGVSEAGLRKLQVVQNSAARLLTGTSRRDHITPVLYQLHWLPVKQRIRFKILCLTYKAIHNDTAPLYLKDLIESRQHIKLMRSASSSAISLYIPRTRKS